MQLVVTYADATGSESSTYSLGMPNDLVATLDSTTAQQGLAIHVTGVTDGGTTVSTGVSYAWQVSSDNGQHWTTVGTNSSFTPVCGRRRRAAAGGRHLRELGENESTTDSLGIVAPAKEWMGGSHDWQTAGQWTSSGAPTSSDNAVVDVSGTYTVTIDQAAAAHSLVVNDSGATVEIFGGNTLTLGGDLTIDAGKLHDRFRGDAERHRHLRHDYREHSPITESSKPPGARWKLQAPSFPVQGRSRSTRERPCSLITLTRST